MPENVRPAQILVVDDEPLVCESLALILGSVGYTVACVDSGAHAVAHCDVVAPAIVICDLTMPEMDGVETIRRLRARHPGVRFICVSGSTGLKAEELLDAALHAGADRSMTKPFTMAALLNAVNELVGPPRAEWPWDSRRSDDHL